MALELVIGDEWLVGKQEHPRLKVWKINHIPIPAGKSALTLTFSQMARGRRTQATNH
jgi:hypothetical protein